MGQHDGLSYSRELVVFEFNFFVTKLLTGRLSVLEFGSTLKFTVSLRSSASSLQLEVSGIAIAQSTNLLWCTVYNIVQTSLHILDISNWEEKEG